MCIRDSHIPADGTFKYGQLDSSSVLSTNWVRNKSLFHDFLNTPPEE